MSKGTLDTLWYEKYRPQTLDDMVMYDSIKKKVLEFKEDQSIPHLLLVGGAGIGKSTLAKILVNDILDCEYRTFNASSEGGIDTIRNEVKGFAHSASLDGKIKIVILGEADGLTKPAQDSLKEIIEDSSEMTRFIFTANDINKLSVPIISRCQRFDLNFSVNDFTVSCVKILVKEGIELNSNVEELKQLISSCYPDFRRAIGEIQKNVHGGKFELTTNLDKCSLVGELWTNVLEGEPEKARAYCIEHVSEFSAYDTLMCDMTDYAFNNMSIKKSRVNTLTIHKFICDHQLHVNKELNFYCCLIELAKLNRDN